MVSDRCDSGAELAGKSAGKFLLEYLLTLQRSCSRKDVFDRNINLRLNRNRVAVRAVVYRACALGRQFVSGDHANMSSCWRASSSFGSVTAYRETLDPSKLSAREATQSAIRFAELTRPTCR